jgi:hypothetical protein
VVEGVAVRQDGHLGSRRRGERGSEVVV